MSRLVLWRLPSSPPSRAVMMLADILGLELEFKEPDYLTMEHKSPKFLKLNPMGTVPVLEDGDFVISESHTIMKYLLTKYGAAHQERLYPSEVKARALVDQALFFDTGVMFISLKNVAKPTILQGLPGPTEQHLDHIRESYDTLELYLQRTPYVAADRLTLADLSLGSTVTALQGIHKLDAEKYPRSADWLARLERESFFKNINAPGAASLAKVLSISWAKNKQKTNA